MSEQLLRVDNLQTFFHTDEGVVKAVNGVSFTLNKGETLGVVGESGSGKSILSMSIMGLIPTPPGVINGRIEFKGRNLLEISESEYRQIRGNDMAMIFQEPMTSLNPVLTVGKQIMEVYKYHQKISPKEAKQRAIEMLRLVGIPKPEDRFNDYPHLLSGGMRQRVMIAIALACSPELLIADEPTTALDVTIQAQILELMRELKTEFNTALILISHDFGVVSKVADKILIMYAGKVVEFATKEEVFSNPKHPYTEGLLSSIPNIKTPVDRLTTIPGTVPHPQAFPKGCAFHPRCKYAMDICRQKEPTLTELSNGVQVSCWKHERGE
ncbi:ABC transporter ATP-binding protein [Ornithinibacillus sp. 4-3]|uniref:ABC transporter ATP-binding protein n=1 Tax=Ornithinibacillus sp. 4-3 TaxID=3231488 RepID=A0AB39HMN9_9BACI